MKSGGHDLVRNTGIRRIIHFSGCCQVAFLKGTLPAAIGRTIFHPVSRVGQGFSAVTLLKFGARSFFVEGANIVGCLVASLGYDNQNVQMLLNVPWGAKSHPVENHCECLRVWGNFFSCLFGSNF